MIVCLAILYLLCQKTIFDICSELLEEVDPKIKS